MNAVFGLLLLCPVVSMAADWYVDDDNQTGTASGTGTAPFTSISEAIEAAASGDIILVASGTYNESLTLSDTSLTLRGAFAGGTSADYASGIGGDFVTRFTGNDSSHVKGKPDRAVILIEGQSDGTIIDGFMLTGGRRGIELPDWPVLDGVTIINNRIEGNGLAPAEPTEGGGVYLGGNENTRVESNWIAGNRGTRGGGIAGGATGLIVTDNQVIANEGVSDHGGGLYLWGTGEVTDNLIAENRIGETLGYGWGGGLIVFGEATEMTISGNRFEGNYAPSAGGGVFIDDGATATFDHNLVYRNQTDDWLGGAAFYVDCYDENLRSSASVSHSTFVANGNPAQGDINAIIVACSSLTMKNSILWGNPGQAFFIGDTASLTVSHSLIQNGWSELLPDAQGGYVVHPDPWPGTGNLIDTDPLFANSAEDDYQLRSIDGRWVANNSQWVTDTESSPAIDAADPASPYANEPEPNGGRANLGAYGNTAEASRSATTGMSATLTVSVNGSGSVVSDPAGIQCPGVCGATFTLGSQVRLTATPDLGTLFASWGGDCGHAAISVCELELSGDLTALASFTQTESPARPSDTDWRVTEIYIATLGYAPDNEGLQYWIHNIDDGDWTPTEVAQSFFDQPLVQEMYPPGQGYDALIESLYQNLFGRGVDADGLVYWREELSTGRITRNQMIIALINGGWANPEAATDMARFANRVEVSLAFAEEQINQGIVYSALSARDQDLLRSLGQSLLDDVGADAASRDAAIARIPDLLSSIEDTSIGVACGADPGQLFGPEYPWNQRVDSSALDAESATIIDYLQTNHTSGQRFRIDGPSDEPGNTYGITLLSANATTPHETFTPTEDHYSPDCDTVPVPIPAGGAIEGESGYACENDGDCHLLVTDAASCRLYEMWRADRVSASDFRGGCLAVWDLTAAYDPTLRGDACTSADAAGLPISALMFSADDIAAGTISHAIRFILPNALMRERVYVRPATHSTGATSGSAQAPPYGARLRLKADFDMSRLSAPAQVVARALQRYGMILSDGGNITFTALNDRFTERTWAEVGLGPNDLTALEWSDFEVVELGDRYVWDGDCNRTPLTDLGSAR